MSSFREALLVSTILAVVQRKGGAGKTTLAVNLAGEFAASGLSTAVIDADPQGSAASWASMGRLGYPVYPLPLDAANVGAWGEAVRAIRSDLLIIDTPAFLNSAVYGAVIVADIVLLPCGASGLDLDATRQTLDLISTVRQHRRRPGPEVLLVPARVNFRTLEGSLILDELAKLHPVVAPPVGHRTAFVRAYTTGESVATFAPQSAADDEMKAVADFVLKTAKRQRTSRPEDLSRS